MKIGVSVAVALATRQEVLVLELEAGATVADALAAPEVRSRFPELTGREPTGIWSRPCARETVLREGDRVEVYRPLKADAKAMRRARARTASPRSRNAP